MHCYSTQGAFFLHYPKIFARDSKAVVLGAVVVGVAIAVAFSVVVDSDVIWSSVSVVVRCAVGSIKYHLTCFVLKIQIHTIHSVSCDSVQ